MADGIIARTSTLIQGAGPLVQHIIPEKQREDPSASALAGSRVQATPIGLQAQAQDPLVSKLHHRIDDLERELDQCCSAELERVSREWQTSEDLLQQSQRDNASKHETIEQYKHYVKDMEKLLAATLGPDWKTSHEVRLPLAQSTTYSASTPLPQPAVSTVHRSASLLSPSKRSSKAVNRHVSMSTLAFEGQATAQRIQPGITNSPIEAMRKLVGGDHATPESLDHSTRADDEAAQGFTRLQLRQLHELLSVPTQASSLRATPDLAQAVLSEAADLIARAEKRSDERHKTLQAMLDTALDTRDVRSDTCATSGTENPV